MKYINKKTTGAAALAALLLVAAAGVRATSTSAEIAMMRAKGMNLLRNWDYKSALELSNKMMDLASTEGNGDDMANARTFKAYYCFYAGDYVCGRDEMKAAGELRTLSDKEKEFLDRLSGMADTWADAEEMSSEHFTIRFKPGKDRVLAGPALVTLEKAYAVLTKDFSEKPPYKTLVEVYPTIKSFSNSTGISEKDLEESGTIAICKYRRLMINTPRSLTRGYDYLDTVSHEYVHFLVYAKYGESIPIWLHEGLAKYQESRWRGDKGGELTPGHKSVLASALKLNELISFDRMSPSFAFLETPRQGQLAFAEVTTVIAYLVDNYGWNKIFELCDKLSAGQDYRTAIREVTGKDFDRFWKDWTAYARAKNYKEIPGMEITAYEIRKGDDSYDDSDDEVGAEDLASGDEWEFVRLGDLLRDRGHLQAAEAEYEKALELSPYSPRILNKAGLCYYLDEKYEQSEKPLKLADSLYPGYSTTNVNLGKTLFAKGDKDGAAKEFEEALRINPFNPIPYGYLIKIYDEKGDAERVEGLYEDLKTISG